MERMNAAQMQKLEAYFSVMEKAGGITDSQIRNYVKREFGISLSKTYIPVLRTRLKRGKQKEQSGKTLADIRSQRVDVSEYLPIHGEWKPPFCVKNKDQEMSLDLFRSTEVHFIKIEIPEAPSE